MQEVCLDGKPSSNNQPDDHHAKLALAIQVGPIGVTRCASRRSSASGRSTSTNLGGDGSSGLLSARRGLADKGAVGVDTAGLGGDHTSSAGGQRNDTGGETDGGGRERDGALGGGEAGEGGDDEGLELHFCCLFGLFVCCFFVC